MNKTMWNDCVFKHFFCVISVQEKQTFTTKGLLYCMDRYWGQEVVQRSAYEYLGGRVSN